MTGMHDRFELQRAFALEELASAADELGDDALAREARALAERAADGRYYVACIGQFKRGKSTLINALLGQIVLPTGVVPVTSVPTIIRHGHELAARVRVSGVRATEWLQIDPGTLADWISEECNPENAKGVLAMELFVPCALLESGMCLVDTPGLGSIFAGNSAATREFVPHIDVAVVVLGADPPITGDELSLAELVSRDVEHVMFVFNKADRVGELELEEARIFTARVVASRLGERVSRMVGGHIFAVSALEQLEGTVFRRDWDALVGTLEDLAERSGGAIICAAVRRGSARLRARLISVIDEEIAALTRPLDHSASRLDRLTERTAAAERALADLGPLFSAEQSRLARLFAERRTTMLQVTAPSGAQLLSERLRQERVTHSLSRNRGFALAREVAHETITPWLAESEGVAEQAYRAAVGRFVAMVNDFVRDFRAESSVGEASTVLPDELAFEEQLRAKRSFYFHDFENLATPAGIGPLMEQAALALLPRSVAARRIDLRARGFLMRLLETNAFRVEGDLNERVLESRRALESELRLALSDARAVASRALERARASHAAGTEAIESALTRLRRVRAGLGE